MPSKLQKERNKKAASKNQGRGEYPINTHIKCSKLEVLLI
jgi:hypothetical protein